MSKASRERKRQSAEIQKATDELLTIRSDLDRAYELFNSTSDPVLVDASIYEINALRSRYNYKLKGIKSLFL